ncbi:unnamed protein product [Adineta steineri]|uniref:Uncharacterized protein n=1 Tax=Adineta steineri TaxID=433720 RepID=A0A814X9T4_9BILA|nr:unnamed protein product [Adineta steineri]CAF1293581.1 unnamed protein product [Adineta steineri]
MASSNDNEDMTTRTSLGAMIVNEIQEMILDNTENMSQSSGSSIQGADIDFNNLILTNDTINNTRRTTTDDTPISSTPIMRGATTAVNEEVQMLTNRLGSIFNENNTPNENNGTESSTDDEHEVVSQAATPTEALYTDKRQIDFIPCLLETSYVPDGWLGILIRDRLYIDFSSADHFDTAFEQLIEEIKEIENRLQMASSKLNCYFNDPYNH